MFSVNALSAVKFVASGVVGIGAGKIVGKIIKNNVSPETLIDKVTVVSASWVISGIVTTATKKYTNEMIDETYNGVVGIVDKFKLDAKLGRISRGESTFETEGLNSADYIKDFKNGGKYVYVGETSDGAEVPITDKFQATDGKYGNDK